MIPPRTGSAAPPVIIGNLVFHAIVDDFNRAFSLDGPGDLNGIRLHYEMMQVARTQAKALRGFDVRAESQEAALAEMKAYFSRLHIFGFVGRRPGKMKTWSLSSREDALGPSASPQPREGPRAALSPARTLFAAELQPRPQPNQAGRRRLWPFTNGPINPASIEFSDKLGPLGKAHTSRPDKRQ
jgi:hypothetical protein